MAKDAKLIFGRNDNHEGPRTSGVESYGDAHPIRIVRELIQNSLDAGSEAKRDVIKISFKTEKIHAKNILGMDEYKKAFASAIRLMKEQKSFDDEFVQLMRDNIEGRVNALWVVDNGVGLDVDRMKHLLSDGVSNTENPLRGGSFGIGHTTAFASSDLRYIIYGGCSEGNEKILSGHAILASHEDEEGNSMGKDGIIKKQQGSLWKAKKGDFPDEYEIPKYWREKLETIERDYGTGSFVCILAFNDFKMRESDVKSSVFYTAAVHFMPAIHEGKLEVSFNGEHLTQKRLSEMTAQRKDEKQRRKKFGFAGRKAPDIYQALSEGNHKRVTLANGESVSIYVLSSADLSNTHIHLYRNGMWITDELKHNGKHDFNDFQAFCAVIVVEANDAESLFKVIRKAEGPTHTEVELARLVNREEKEFLEEALRKVRDAIKEIAPQKESESIESDFIVLGEGSVGDITRIVTRPVTPRPTGTSIRPVPDPNPVPDPKPVPRPSLSGKHLKASSALSRDGDNLHVSFKSHEIAQNIQVRVVCRSGSDLSCDKPEYDEFIAIADGVTLDGKEIPKDYYQSGEHGTINAFHIGAIKKEDTEHTLKIPCVSLPSSGSLDVEFIRRAKRGDSS